MNATATGNVFSVSIMVVLLLAIIGLVIWAVCSNATAKATAAETGRAFLYAGLVAFCIAISGAVFHC